MSKARVPYWNLIVKTLLTRRQAFPVAVKLAILGQHYQRFMERIVGMNV